MSRKFIKGDLVGKQKVLMVSDSWIPEGKSRSSKRAKFECPFCGEIFETTIDHVSRCRNGITISCGCQSDKNRYRVGQKIGEHQVEILELYPTEKTENGHKDRKAKFKCKDCGEPFICDIKQVAKKGRKSCGCTLRKQELKENQILNGVKVLEPNIRQDKVSGRFISKFECPYCGEPFEWQNSYVRTGHKTNCGCQNSKSHGEDELLEYIQSLVDYEVKSNARILNLKEIDVYIKELNLGFEFNGLYWHSESLGKGSSYHINKTKLAKEKGIDLVHIFEHQWKFKKEIVKDLIKKRLNKVDNKIYARKCELVELTTKEAKEFIDKNHLQGYASCNIKLGLKYMNELVSVMTFGKSRFNKKYDYELVRFCNKLNTSIIGGASKLLKYFERNNKGTLISYCDISIFNGSLYESLGFDLSHISKPNYFYFLPSSLEVFSRQQFQKHKLKDKLEKFNPKESEYQNMLNNGYMRYWDCGNKAYVKEIT